MKKLTTLAIFLICILLLVSCASAPRYQTLPEGKAVMVASWYGPKFHGRKTASGEVFDMYRLTAAHKSLPFGTRLRVTNPENGKSVVVKINDRGPFVRGRDLDLSYGAARRIGLIQKGTSRVYVEVLGRDERYVKTVKYAIHGSGLYTIQVGSFRMKENAWRLKRALSYTYRNVRIVKKNIKGQVYYRVLVGRFRSLARAESVALRLTDEGYNAILTVYEEVL
ncbi:MAG: septal ring lytic transglycosylase RlpA family protein [Nitrospirae bacterium]|nr:MAG: septal ring lytic transglycosylase RlpA family protein [Nitrospirota bacterium]